MKALHSPATTHPVTERHTPDGINLHFQDLDVDGRTFKYTLQKLEAVMWVGFSWSELCALSGTNAHCDDSKAKTLLITLLTKMTLFYNIRTFCRRGVSCRGRVVGMSSAVSLLNKRNICLPLVPSSALLRPLKKQRLQTANKTNWQIARQMALYVSHKVFWLIRIMHIALDMRNKNEWMLLVNELQNSECHESHLITKYCPDDQILTCHHSQLSAIPFKK